MNDDEAAEFSADETHGFAKLESFEIHKSSAGLGWPTAYFSSQAIKPYSASFDKIPSVFISIVNGGSFHADIDIHNEIKHLRSPPGGIAILAENVPFKFNLHSHVETTHLYIKRSLINEVAKNIYGLSDNDVTIRSRLCVFDSVIESICREIRNSLDKDPGVSFSYIDYLVRAIAAHLLRNYSNLSSGHENGPSSGRLSPLLLDRTRERVEKNLSERLTVARLAADSGMSADHFGRLFKQSMGMTLHQFVIRRRIERASYLLADTNKPIIQIAHECGFADQVHLTRVFRRHVGTTPAAFRNERKK